MFVFQSGLLYNIYVYRTHISTIGDPAFNPDRVFDTSNFNKFIETA